ncbi:hypothetical protein [Bartonella tamiae]|uniref:Uncharacterized protein n=1 Tax=Bartonella tamiae Th239 TaxID=1094558 RepID=J1JZ06_9HYPH|nr:hypothetical protein [Bartonella tamiae]EJF90347.1 hypothetical protein ME5_00748 [Bartonella tamiae Th239]EJF93712.1 hypothetical protein MEG_01136 [Bartonella tamiae Th307]
MVKRISDALELSTHTRKSHFINSLLEYALIIVICLIAITATSFVLVEQFKNLIQTEESVSSLSIYDQSSP